MSEGFISDEPIHLNELDLHMSEGFISDEPIHLNESDFPEELKTVKSACIPVKTSQPSYADFSSFFSAGFQFVAYMWPHTMHKASHKGQNWNWYTWKLNK